MVDLRQLQHFVAVAETLNFRAAAERLLMTQPPLSVSIRKLEREVGAELFARSTQKVQLTRAGEAALPDARAALLHAEQVVQSAQSAARGFTGTLGLGYVGSAEYSLLPTLLTRFRRTYPDVVVQLVQGTNEGLLTALEDNSLDVAIVRTPLTERRPLALLPLEDDVLAAALHPRHQLTRRKQVRLEDLAAERFIDYTASQTPGLHAVVSMMFADAGLSVAAAHETTQVQTVLFLVESGLGVALVPSRAEPRAGDRVAFRPITPRPVQRIGLSLASNPAMESAPARRLRELAVDLRDEVARN